MKSTCALCGTTHAELVHARLILGSGMSTFDANLAMRGAIEPGRVLGDGNGRRPQPCGTVTRTELPTNGHPQARAPPKKVMNGRVPRHGTHHGTTIEGYTIHAPVRLKNLDAAARQVATR